MYSKYLISILFAFAFGTLMANESKPFVLNGKLPGTNNKYIYLTYEGSGEKYHTDSAMVKNGVFSFKGELSSPVMASLYLDWEKARFGMGNMAAVFLEPGTMMVQLKKDDFDNAKLTGSKPNTEYDDLKKLQSAERSKLSPLSKKWNLLNEEYIDAIKAKKDSVILEEYKEKLEKIRDEMNPYYEKLEGIEEKFLNAHPNSYVTAYLLRFKVNRIPLEKGMAYYNRMSKPVQESIYGKAVNKELEGLKMGSPGSVAHVFAKQDINGENLDLADYKGKYVLIDFWASWCVPCRKGNPHLKKIYSQYKDKGFEIIGVSDDDSNPEAWKKAVEKDGIGVWKHVLRGLDMKKREKGEANPEDLSDYYGISSLPTKILIDKNGVIIGRYSEGTADDSAMDARLAEVFTPNVSIKGEIKGLKAGEIIYCRTFSDRVGDSVTATENNFKFNINVPAGMGDLYLLQVGRKYQENSSAVIFLDSGNVTVTSDGPWFKDAKISGTKTIMDMRDLNDATKAHPMLKNADSLNKLANELYKKNDTLALKKLNPAFEKMDSIRKIIYTKWITEHPSSAASAQLLGSNAYMFDAEESAQLFSTLTPAAKNNAIAKRLQHSIDVSKATAIGKMAIDFTQNDTLGKPVSLTDFRGKYVFIDFWASWCVPCRKENPTVVSAFKKYGGEKFAILGVSLDYPGKKDLWLKAINADGLAWTHVSDLNGWSNAIAQQYDIRSIPSNLLIDPAGKIIAKDLHGEELSTKLATLNLR